MVERSNGAHEVQLWRGSCRTYKVRTRKGIAIKLRDEPGFYGLAEQMAMALVSE